MQTNSPRRAEQLSIADTRSHESVGRRLWRVFRRRVQWKRPYRTGPQKWLSPWLHPFAIIALILATLALIAAILSLTIVSHHSRGIADISKTHNGRKIAGFQVGRGLLWTSVPVLIAQSYNLWLGATVSALADRQPYVELRDKNGKGAPARVSILLDYRTYSGISKPYQAGKNGHILLAFSFALPLIFKLIVAPISSHLFVVDDDILSIRSVTVRQSTSFDDQGIDEGTDLVPMINTVAGIRLYNASFPTWTNSFYSFAQFIEPTQLPASTSNSNITMSTTAYSLGLDCRALERSQYNLSSTDFFNSPWTLHAIDRGCSIYNIIDRADGYRFYMQTSSKVDCPFEFESSEGRIIVFAAATPDGNRDRPTNISVISCTTTYYNSTGHLQVAYDETQPTNPSIHRFWTDKNATMYPRPLFWKVFEQNMCSATLNDNTQTYYTSILGRLILDYARRISPQRYLDSGVLTSSTQSIVSSVYAVTTSTYLQQPLSTPKSVTGSVSSASIRLRIVNAISITLLVVLLFTTAVLTWALIHSHRHESILFEEPTGMLGAATFLANGSDAQRTADRLRQTVPSGRWLWEYRNGARDNEYERARWRATDWDQPREMRIQMSRNGGVAAA